MFENLLDGGACAMSYSMTSPATLIDLLWHNFPGISSVHIPTAGDFSKHSFSQSVASSLYDRCRVIWA
jgi:hypothetical protein